MVLVSEDFAVAALHSKAQLCLSTLCCFLVLLLVLMLLFLTLLTTNDADRWL